MIKKRDDKLIFFIILIIIIFMTAFFIWIFTSEKEKTDKEKECLTDANCVPATCCHPNSCISKEQAPNCSDIFCTAVCAPNTLDCNQGSCLCVEGKCKAVFE